MSTFFHTRVIASAIAVIVCGETQALAQETRSTRPYRALFGGSTANPDVHHSFDVTTSVMGGYDDNSELASGGVGASPLLRSGAYLGLSGGLSYSWQGRRTQAFGSAGTNARYYHDTAEWIGTEHSAGFGFSAQIGQRFRVTANQGFSAAPSYLYSLTPDFGAISLGTAAGGGDFPLGDGLVHVYDTTALASFAITRRGSVEAVSSYRYSALDTSSTSNETDLRSYSVGGRFRYGLTRNGSLRLGYVYRQGAYGLTGVAVATGLAVPTVVHDIDVGLDYRRALSLTRRTSIGFSTGSTIVTVPVEGSTNGQLQYRVVGDVGLQHEIGRTWLARLAYNRGVGFAEAFNQPVFADGVNLSVSGFLARRVDFRANAGVAVGDVGLGTVQGASTASSSSFQTWNISTRVRYAVSAMWAVYGEYLYYSQDLGTAPVVPSGVPSVLNRQSAQVGLTLWVPLLRR